MKLAREKLLDVLNLVKPGLGANANIEQMGHFIFTGDDVVTYNDRIFISHPFETDFVTSVPSMELHKILSKISSKQISMKVKGNKIKVETRSTSIGLATLEEDQIISVVKKLNKQIKKEQWHSLPKDVLEALKLTVFSASKDASTAALTCIKVIGNKVLACDNYRAAMYTLKKKVKSNFLIQSVAVPELLNLKPVSYCSTDSWINFKSADDVVFSVRKMEGKFPNVLKLFEKFEGKKTIQIPKALQKQVDLVSVLEADEIDIEKSVTIRIDDKGILVSTEKERGWAEAEVDFEYSGDPIEFLINPIFLDEILRYVTSMKVGSSVGLFKTENFSHLIQFFGGK